MSKKKHVYCILCVFFSCALINIASLVPLYAMGDTAHYQSDNVDQLTIPNFTVSDVNGGEFQFSSLSGKVVVVNFWATWCPVCKDEMPHFMELRENYHAQGLEVLGISLDENGIRVVRPFVERMKLNYPIVIGGQNEINLFGGIVGLPTTFVVDREARVVERYIGYVDKKTLEEAVKKYLLSNE